jgi:hypothetical protein
MAHGVFPLVVGKKVSFQTAPQYAANVRLWVGSGRSNRSGGEWPQLVESRKAASD